MNAAIDIGSVAVPGQYTRRAVCALPVLSGQIVEMSVWTNHEGLDPTVALVYGSSKAQAVPLVRVQSACLTGEVFGSLRCDCRQQLQAALDAIVASEWGIVIYPVSHEGRGIGLVDKIRAYAEQDQGHDTFEANRRLGLAEDQRSYEGTAAVLLALSAERIRLLTRNPLKVAGLRAYGLEIETTIPHDVAVSGIAKQYVDHKMAWFEQMQASAAKVN